MDIKGRFRNKAWVLSLVSALVLLAQLVLKPMGIEVVEGEVMAYVNAVLSILMILGVVIDPTTPGIGDY